MINNLSMYMYAYDYFFLSNKLGGDKCYERKNFKNRLIEREKDYCWGEGGRIDAYDFIQMSKFMILHIISSTSREMASHIK